MRLAVEKVVKAHRDRSATEEVVEVYQSELRPVKLFNDIIDELIVSDRACDVSQDASAQIVHRHPILVEASLSWQQLARWVS